MKQVVAPIEDVVEWLTNAGHVPSITTSKLYRSLIDEELHEFIQAEVDKEGEAAEFKELLDLMWVLIGYAHARGWPVTEGWMELARSNYSKFTVEDGKLVLKKRDDGKVLKPETYVPADMQTVLLDSQRLVNPIE